MDVFGASEIVFCGAGALQRARIGSLQGAGNCCRMLRSSALWRRIRMWASVVWGEFRLRPTVDPRSIPLLVQCRCKGVSEASKASTSEMVGAKNLSLAAKRLATHPVRTGSLSQVVWLHLPFFRFFGGFFCYTPSLLLGRAPAVCLKINTYSIHLVCLADQASKPSIAPIQATTKEQQPEHQHSLVGRKSSTACIVHGTTSNSALHSTRITAFSTT